MRMSDSSQTVTREYHGGSAVFWVLRDKKFAVNQKILIDTAWSDATPVKLNEIVFKPNIFAERERRPYVWCTVDGAGIGS